MEPDTPERFKLAAAARAKTKHGPTSSKVGPCVLPTRRVAGLRRCRFVDVLLARVQLDTWPALCRESVVRRPSYRRRSRPENLQSNSLATAIVRQLSSQRLFFGGTSDSIGPFEMVSL